MYLAFISAYPNSRAQESEKRRLIDTNVCSVYDRVMERPQDELGDSAAGARRLADIPDAEERLHRLDRLSIGHLRYDPDVPREVIEPITDACTEVHRWPTISFVEGYLRPQLQTDTRRIMGTDAIASYVRSLEPKED